MVGIALPRAPLQQPNNRKAFQNWPLNQCDQNWAIFEKSWQQIFVKSSPNIFEFVWAILKQYFLNINCLSHFWGNFRKNLATLYFSIWSQCSQRKQTLVLLRFIKHYFCHLCNKLRMNVGYLSIGGYATFICSGLFVMDSNQSNQHDLPVKGQDEWKHISRGLKTRKFHVKLGVKILQKLL